MIKQALILSSGLGKRMRPITNIIPKPMVEIYKQSLITRIIDQLYKVGVTKIVVNLFYKADLLKKHIEHYIEKYCSDVQVRFIIEDELHEVWGSIKKSLSYMGNQSFFLVNGDSYWIDTEQNIFSILYSQWDSVYMKSIILLYPKERAIGYDGNGDFDLLDHKIINSIEATKLPYVYIGLQIISPEIFINEKLRKCSIFDIYQQFDYHGIYGVVYNGYWFHIGTPQAITQTESFLKENSLCHLA